MSETCIICKKDITENPVPVYPGKVPGAKKVTEVQETPYEKKMDVPKIVPVMKDGKVVLDTGGNPVTETIKETVIFTKGIRRKTSHRWEAGATPIPYAHKECIGV